MSTSIFKLLTAIIKQQKICEGQPLTISAESQGQFSVVYIEFIGQPNTNGLQYRFNENDEWKTYTPDLKFHFIHPDLAQQFLDIWGIGTEQYDALNEQLAQAIENNIFLQQIQFRNTEQTLSLDENNYVHIVITDAGHYSIQGISDKLNEIIFVGIANYNNNQLSLVHMTLSGNAQSLLNYREDCTPYCFYKLFENIDLNVGIPNYYIQVDIQLPSVKLADWCYAYMFSKWLFTSKAIPVLPAMTLAPHCYDHMYYQTAGGYACFGLQNLTLPAIELAQGCYEGMFAYLEDGWSYENIDFTAIYINPSLLPAEKMAPYCYKDMFRGVRIYPQLPMLPATELAQGCYKGMFAEGLAAYDFNTESAAYFECPELPATELAEKCYSEMFTFNEALIICTLPATTLAKNCYKDMFRGCYSLSSITVAFTDWGDIENPTEYDDDYSGELIDVQYTYNWIAELGNLYNSQCTFTCPAELPQQFGTSKIPDDWTVQTY